MQTANFLKAERNICYTYVNRQPKVLAIIATNFPCESKAGNYFGERNELVEKNLLPNFLFSRTFDNYFNLLPEVDANIC